MPVEQVTARVVPGGVDRDQRVSNATTRSSPQDPRSSGRHDRDRVYYSAAFRRLAGVTQVFTPSAEGFLTHNRLTHSLKVAQVGRAIAEVLMADVESHGVLEKLGGVDADVVEASALSHDIGHPPFGHVGEVVLDNYARTSLQLPEGFEGNAQTFRIVTRLEPRSRHMTGLDLTAATRAAVAKYPWVRADSKPPKTAPAIDRLRWSKFSVYSEDLSAFDSARTCVPLPEHTQSLEAAIMDVADDITYALHDLEDFHGARLLNVNAATAALSAWQESFATVEPQPAGPLVENTFEHLRTKLLRDYPEQFDAETYRDAVGAAQGHLQSLLTETVGSRRGTASTRRFVSRLITDFMGALELCPDPSPTQPPIRLESLQWHLVQVLKQITQRFVIHRADFAVIQRGQQTLLGELLECLRAWTEDDDDKHRLPSVLKEGHERDGARAIIDYVAGLSDLQAAALHRALRGGGPQSLASTFTP